MDKEDGVWEESKTAEKEIGDKAPETPKYRGLYEKVNISVRALDAIIIGCIAVIIIVVAINLRNPGYNVTFDSRGGTDVPVQRQQYGELLLLPEEPTREGYEFTGWYIDPSCFEKWDTDNKVIEGAITLYAGWEEK